MVYKYEIERIVKLLSDRKKDLQDELKLLPEGDLYILHSNNVKRYYLRLPCKGNRKKERRIGIKKDTETLMSLVRKKYIMSALDVLEQDIEFLRMAVETYMPTDENSVMKDFIEKYPELSEGVYCLTNNSVKWGDERMTASEYHPESLKSTASDGSRRRSVGELLIGAKLSHYKIPYKYEAIAHPDLPYIPDFTIKRPHDGKLIFWEHFGMVNDHDYMEGNRRKLIEYESVGIVPWENLIITYNQSNGGINEKQIDAMIHGWLL